MTTFIAVRCPRCQNDQVAKRGKTARGTQRYLCQNALCASSSFLLDYHNRGCLPEVKDLIIDMSLNASGVRDTGVAVQLVSECTVWRLNINSKTCYDFLTYARSCLLERHHAVVSH